MVPLTNPVDEEEEEGNYNSASDEDFNPENAAPIVDDENQDSSSSEDEAIGSKPSKTKKRKTLAEDVDFDNSGDEATIKKARRKKPKGSGVEDDEGGDGGLIKTRAQRRAEIQERKPLVNTANSSVDVDALWAQMATSKKPPELPDGKEKTPSTIPLGIDVIVPSNGAMSGPNPVTNDLSTPQPSNTSTTTPHLDGTGVPTITINRTYVFAGETLTETRIVPTSSAEARLYLSQQSQQSHSPTSTSTNPPTTTNPTTKPPLRRPTKRPSMFSAPNTGNSTTAGATKPEGPKLTTLQKSKLDWARHVDEEGISEELDEGRKAKGGYLGKMDFLGRMEVKKEEEILKGRGAKGK